jgi:hypothetical protein
MGNRIGKYCNKLNIIKGNRFVDIYFVICKRSVYFIYFHIITKDSTLVTVSHSPCLVFSGLLMG